MFNTDFIQEVLLRYVMSAEERKKILSSCHVDPTAGYMGKTRTICRIKERFMWKGIVKDVQDMVCSMIIIIAISHNIIQCGVL